MTTVDLRAVAEAATPGGWVLEPKRQFWQSSVLWDSEAPDAERVALLGSSVSLKDAAHIASWSPDRAIAALDVIDATKAMLAPEFSSEALANLRAAVDRWEALT